MAATAAEEDEIAIGAASLLPAASGAKRSRYCIGDDDFKSARAAKAHTSGILAGIGIGTVGPDHAQFMFLCDLVQNHADRADKVGPGIRHFRIARALSPSTERHYKTFICRIDDSEVVFSWVHCATRSQWSPKQGLRQACRYAIQDHVQAYRDRQSRLCMSCSTTTGPFQVDHKTTKFQEIVDEFVQTHPPPATFMHDPATHRTRFNPEDQPFATAWTAHHEQRADYQLLCRACNLKKG